MAVKYFPDELIVKIAATGVDTQTFIREAIEEKLRRFKVVK